VEVFDAMFTRGVRAHYVALAVCAPLLISTTCELGGHGLQCGLCGW